VKALLSLDIPLESEKYVKRVLEERLARLNPKLKPKKG
jgi:hypothetical protein